jgi:hypothetical protein
MNAVAVPENAGVGKKLRLRSEATLYLAESASRTLTVRVEGVPVFTSRVALLKSRQVEGGTRYCTTGILFKTLSLHQIQIVLSFAGTMNWVGKFVSEG